MNTINVRPLVRRTYASSTVSRHFGAETKNLPRKIFRASIDYMAHSYSDHLLSWQKSV